MKSKATLSLMEQLVMVLVFALAAAICLRVFAVSGQLSVNGEKRSNAVTYVQNAAESIKLCGGDVQQHIDLMGGTADENGWHINCDKNWSPAQDTDAVYTVGLTFAQEDEPLLGTAEVWAKDKDGDTLFCVTVCWQEEYDG